MHNLIIHIFHKGGGFSDGSPALTTPPGGTQFHFQSTRDVAMFFLLLPFFDTIFLAVGAWLIELENCLAKAPRAMGARENGVTNVPAQSMETKDRGLLTALFYAKTTHSADAAPGADGDGNG